METAAALQQLKKITDALHALNDEEWQAFAAIWQPFTAKRKTTITVAGEVEKYLYFVTEGVQRGYYLHNEKEATVIFTYPYNFGGSADSFLLQQPSKHYYETLTASSFLRTTYHQYNGLLQMFPNFRTFILKSLSITFAGVVERMIELHAFSAEEKFKTLLTRSPHVLQLIPHKYLASYLSIDATTFSKLLSTVRI